MTRSSKLPKDANQLAAEIVRRSTEEPDSRNAKEVARSPISEYLTEIGRKGGLKGGKARAMKLSPRQRQKIAQTAAKIRWKNAKMRPAST